MAGTTVLTSHLTGQPVNQIIVDFTADASDASIPTLAVPFFEGTLVALQTNPGATAPTANYDITLIDDDGLDRLGGLGANRHTSNSERVGVGALVDNAETLTLTFANNSVNSATGQVILFYSLAAAPAYPVFGTVGTSLPALSADGATRDLFVGPYGQVIIGAYDVGASDGQSNTLAYPTGLGGAGRILAESGFLFNGTTWDRHRNNVPVTALASAARTAAVQSPDIPTYNAHDALVFINVSADPAAASITVTLQGKDTESSTYYTILAAAAIAATGLTVLRVGDALTAAANLVAKDILPDEVRIDVAVADADEMTYSVGLVLGV